MYDSKYQEYRPTPTPLEGSQVPVLGQGTKYRICRRSLSPPSRRRTVYYRSRPLMLGVGSAPGKPSPQLHKREASPVAAHRLVFNLSNSTRHRPPASGDVGAIHPAIGGAAVPLPATEMKHKETPLRGLAMRSSARPPPRLWPPSTSPATRPIYHAHRRHQYALSVPWGYQVPPPPRRRPQNSGLTIHVEEAVSVP